MKSKLIATVSHQAVLISLTAVLLRSGTKLPQKNPEDREQRQQTDISSSLFNNQLSVRRSGSLWPSYRWDQITETSEAINVGGLLGRMRHTLVIKAARCKSK